MKNFVQPGINLTLPTPETLVAGQAILIGSIFGIASSDTQIGHNCDLVTEGVFTLPKASVSIILGAKLYWDDVAKKVTTVSASNSYIGTSIEAVATVALTAPVRLNGFIA